VNLDAPREQQIAWAAGLFEGEGSITVSGNEFALTLKNTDESVVRRFWDVLELGSVYGPYDWQGTDGFKRKPYWVWIARRYNAMEALDVMAPWLSSRRLDRGYELTGVRFPVKTPG
jgi:hypothetical protein